MYTFVCGLKLFLLLLMSNTYTKQKKFVRIVELLMDSSLMTSESCVYSKFKLKK